MTGRKMTSQPPRKQLPNAAAKPEAGMKRLFLAALAAVLAAAFTAGAASTAFFATAVLRGALTGASPLFSRFSSISTMASSSVSVSALSRSGSVALTLPCLT